jgi:hypothetical protein
VDHLVHISLTTLSLSLSLLLGEFLVIIGEICNFVAYSFAPALIVTPLGALSVVVWYVVMMSTETMLNSDYFSSLPNQ